MALVAVGVRLDQGRAPARPGTGERLGGDLAHGEQIVAVDEDPGNAVGGGPVRQTE